MCALERAQQKFNQHFDTILTYHHKEKSNENKNNHI